MKNIRSENKMKIWIAGNVPSLKNSKVATSKGVFMSKTCRRYLQGLGIQKYSMKDKSVTGYKKRPNLFYDAVKPLFAVKSMWQLPVFVRFYFVRDSKRKFDVINSMAIICDLLVAHEVLDDDDADNMVPAVEMRNGKCYHVDKTAPGVWLEFL
jgi:hypothetical protein